MPRIRNVGEARPQPFLYVPAISNVSNQWKWHGHKNFLRNRALGLVFSIQSSIYSIITVAKITTYYLPGYGLL